MINKKRFYFIFIILLSILLFFSLSSISYASTPKIISKLGSAFEDIQSWMLKLATPAAAVAVAVGLFMKKFNYKKNYLKKQKKLIFLEVIAIIIKIN